MKKEIHLTIEFDNNKFPEKINWEKTADMQESLGLKSLYISGWEEDKKSTATFSIWTNDMRVDEMQQFFIQNVLTMAKTFQDATGDKTMVPKMKAFLESLETKK